MLGCWLLWLIQPARERRPVKVKWPIGRSETPPTIVNNKGTLHNPRRDVTRPTCWPFIMKPKGIKALKAIQMKTPHTKVVKWVSRTNSRGTKNIPVEVTASTSQAKGLQAEKATSRVEGNEAMLHEANLSPMDVDETFWVQEVEEPVIPKTKRVSSPIGLSLTAFDISLSLSIPSPKSSFHE